MGFITKYKTEILFSVGVFVLFCLLRLPTLTQLPIFTDEAIYLRWAQIALHDANWRFISLTDGKQPLFIWAVLLSMKFIKDPLVAGRLVSVGAGFMTMVGFFFLGREAFKNRWVGLVSAFLYAIFPFALVYDRMAIYDSLVATFAIWGIYLTILLFRQQKLDKALLMGFVTGGAVLNKTNGFFNIYLLPFAFILFDFTQKQWQKRLVRLLGLCALVVVMTYGFYSILRLSPYFYIINQKNAVFFYPLSEWIHHPFLTVFSDFSAFNDWFMRYVGLPLGLTALAALVIDKKFWREKVLFLLWFLIPYVGFAFIGRTIYPRYIFPMTLTLLPLVAYTLVVLQNKLSQTKWWIVVVLVLSYSILTDFLIIYNFANSPIPAADKGQYLTAWPAGVGVKETTEYLSQQAATHKIYIGTEGTFGLMPYALELYLVDNPQVTIKGFWPINSTPPKELLAAAHKEDTYVVFYQDCPACQGVGVAPGSWPLQKIIQIKRIEAGSYLTLYKVLAP
ncbi:MAG TPA: glycosyltransferase family 39 protein [Patescibacteria group bacterium]|nr:glycosyltransferase family 39 protein [Patescibacteria group bacterium]